MEIAGFTMPDGGHAGGRVCTIVRGYVARARHVTGNSRGRLRRREATIVGTTATGIFGSPFGASRNRSPRNTSSAGDTSCTEYFDGQSWVTSLPRLVLVGNGDDLYWLCIDGGADGFSFRKPVFGFRAECRRGRSGFYESAKGGS